MKFEYRCTKCEKTSDWHMNIDNGRISEYVCKHCGMHIGYSGGHGTINLYQKDEDARNPIRYRFVSEPEPEPFHITTASTGAYYYGSGTGATW